MNPLLSPNQPVDTSGISYSDVQSLQRIDTSGDAGIKAAAQQFESLFIGMMLKGMRDANAVLAEGSPFTSPELTMHQEMLDHQWAIHMAESGGIGLAQIIEAQLRGGHRGLETAPTEGGDRGLETAPTMGEGGDRGLETAPTAGEGLGIKAPGFVSREEFVATVRPEIEKAVEGTALEPLHVLAQSALESGWGRKIPHGADGTSSHNLFGIKAGGGWQGPSVEVKTLEVQDGRVQQQRARFRAYPDLGAAVRDYVQFLERHERYREVLKAPDADSFAHAIGESGYATDPAYGRKVRAVIDSLANLTGT